MELENGVECKQFRGPGTLESLLPIVTSPCLTSANMLSFKNFFQELCALIHKTLPQCDQDQAKTVGKALSKFHAARINFVEKISQCYEY